MKLIKIRGRLFDRAERASRLPIWKDVTKDVILLKAVTQALLLGAEYQRGLFRRSETRIHTLRLLRVSFQNRALLSRERRVGGLELVDRVQGHEGVALVAAVLVLFVEGLRIGGGRGARVGDLDVQLVSPPTSRATCAPCGCR